MSDHRQQFVDFIDYLDFQESLAQGLLIGLLSDIYYKLTQFFLNLSF